MILDTLSLFPITSLLPHLFLGFFLGETFAVSLFQDINRINISFSFLLASFHDDLLLSTFSPPSTELTTLTSTTRSLLWDSSVSIIPSRLIPARDGQCRSGPTSRTDSKWNETQPDREDEWAKIEPIEDRFKNKVEPTELNRLQLKNGPNRSGTEVCCMMINLVHFIFWNHLSCYNNYILTILLTLSDTRFLSFSYKQNFSSFMRVNLRSRRRLLLDWKHKWWIKMNKRPLMIMDLEIMDR